LHGADAAVVLDRQVEAAGVLGEVGDDLVAGGVVVGVAGEREPGEAVVARGGEERERVPALAPGCGGSFGGVKDGEAAALLGEVVADGEAGLAAADDDDVVMVHGMWTSRISVTVDRSATKKGSWASMRGALAVGMEGFS
jgi:hypothetical protein